MFITEPIGEEDDLDSFSCGEPALDVFLRKHALPNDRKGLGRTFLLRRKASAPGARPKVLGFYTLSMADLEPAHLPVAIRSGLPRYPAPVALIGRLAVDARTQGQRVGEGLLADAFARILRAQRQVACLGVVVDAKNQQAERFYLRYGFVPLEPEASFPRRLFLPVQTLREADDGGG